VFVLCSNNCGFSCSTLSCTEECIRPDFCIPGCVCPSGYVENDEKKCVRINECPCKHNNAIILSNETVETSCQVCNCSAGCFSCISKNCSDCRLSDWSEWSECIPNSCTGISKRFRNYFGQNCFKSNVLVESRKCHDCTCLYNGITYQVSIRFLHFLEFL